jgi:hypothetical protein
MEGREYTNLGMDARPIGSWILDPRSQSPNLHIYADAVKHSLADKSIETIVIVQLAHTGS